MDTEKITFDDGNWWKIQTVVTRGMRKRFTSTLIGGLNISNGTAVDISDADAISTALMSKPDSAMDAVRSQEDAYLLEGTVGWSWSDDVSIEFIDTLPDRYVSEVLGRMKELYDPIDEEARKN